MTKSLIIIIFSVSTLAFAQVDLNRISQANRIFFTSEINGLTANVVNPAALSINSNDDGFLFGYDFIETNNQGNSLASFSMGNFGFTYQDIYNYDNIRVQSYSANLSIGGDFLAIGTFNKINIVSYPTYSSSFFSVDAGIIIRPAKSVSLSYVARNLGEPTVDSLNFSRYYTAGIGIFLFNDVLQLFGEIDFNQGEDVNENTAGSAGIVLHPISILQLRAGTYRDQTKNYEGFIALNFLIENSFGLLVSARFNEDEEALWYSIMLMVPLQTVKF